MSKIQAHTLLALLETRHGKDVFIPECKDGPTVMTEHVRLDAWAMRRSWTRPMTWGYEIKVSRSDWLKDDKWRAYLDYCDAFYFVCPSKVIRVEEVPAEAGLVWCSTNGTRLYTKKKAPDRNVTIPQTFWRYIVMCRAQIGHTFEADRPSDRDRWRRWLKQKDEDKSLGHACGQKISRLLADRIYRMESDNKRLKTEQEDLVDMRKFCKSVGINPHTWQKEKRIRALKDMVPEELVEAITAARQAVCGLDDKIREIREV